MSLDGLQVLASLAGGGGGGGYKMTVSGANVIIWESVTAAFYWNPGSKPPYECCSSDVIHVTPIGVFCILERGTNGDVFIRQALLSMTREREYAIVVNKKENSLEQNETCRTSTGRKTDEDRSWKSSFDKW